MIRLYRDDSNYGVILFNSRSSKQIHSEICDSKRFKELVNTFFLDKAELYVPKDRQDLIEDVLNELPYLTGSVVITELKKFNMTKLLSTVVTSKKKSSASPSFVAVGIILGTALLLPTSIEYSATVLAKTESVHQLLVNEEETELQKQKRDKLYLSVGNLYKQEKVDVFSYKNGKYSIVFSSSNKDLTLDKLGTFDNATLSLVSTLENDKEIIHIYRLEGNL